MLEIDRANTILYCERWPETAAFYRDTLALPVAFERDWLLELRLTEDAYLTVADASRATVGPPGGRGVTLTWRVRDLGPCHARLAAAGVPVEPIVRHPWGARLFRFRDPEGNRLEIWSDAIDPEGTP
jgi:catechol 2,3-dioxygenase-like lactoylglutathione lyase family enzyme